MKLTPAQIARYAAGAGFTGAGLRNAVAVALAESGGRTDAVGVNRDSHRSKDRGLWQINDYWHREVSDADAFNPAAAAAAAYRISNGGRDWSPWATWKNGAARAQLGRARVGVAQAGHASSSTQATPVLRPGIPIIPPSDLIPGIPNSNGKTGPLHAFETPGGGNMFGTGIALAVKAGAWIADPHNWARVAMVTGGSVGILLALRMIAESGAAGSTAQAASATLDTTVKAGAKLAAVL